MAEDNADDVPNGYKPYAVTSALHRLCYRHIARGYGLTINQRELESIRKRNRYTYAISCQLPRVDYLYALTPTATPTSFYVDVSYMRHDIKTITGKNFILSFCKNTALIFDEGKCYSSVFVSELLRLGCTVYVK